MSEKRFDMTVNLGHIIIAASTIGSVAFAYGNLDTRVDKLEENVQTNTEIVNKFDVLEEKMNMQTRALNRIEDKLDE